MNFFDYLMNESKSLDKDFILGGKDAISFKELYSKSLQFANYLNRNFGKGENIVLVSPNSVFSIVAYMGIIKSGNVFVPVDHAIEQSNLDYIVDQVECKLILCHSKLEKQFDFPDTCEIINELDLDLVISSFSSENCEALNDPSLLAEIVFTSGSTGRPKGVMLSHENLIVNTTSILKYLGLTEKDRVCTVLPFHYCYGLSLLHTHLKVGGSMVLNNSFIFLGSVISDIKKYKCTGFSGVPSHFQILLKKSSFFKDDLPHLKYLTQAGGKLHNNFIQDICQAFPDKRFYVMYGQTEATARLSYLPPDLVFEKMGSIGRAIDGVELKVVDDNGNELDTGIEGELVARGRNIMKGYFKDDRETSETIKEGWLHTGDLAKMDEDGFFYIVGRKKEFIKVRGKRVSPKEIEEVILRLPEVVHCKIEAYSDELTGEGILARISTSNGSVKRDLQGTILEECRKHLVEYKIPTRFKFEESMNLKSSGKS
jgi:acyl-CoA synthetase (AMP-forming)/AMP-acid ligase II